MPKYKVLLTLITACDCIGQGVLGTKEPLTWTEQPLGDVAQAVFTRIDTETMKVVEVLHLDANDWREYENAHAEFTLVVNVANGHTLARAFELTGPSMNRYFKTNATIDNLERAAPVASILANLPTTPAPAEPALKGCGSCSLSREWAHCDDCPHYALAR